ncbi:MAG: transporter substrate-binding domain-containing protein [Planctomycetota bacterium]|jgi:polar amino acid transport system substrate-binding protein
MRRLAPALLILAILAGCDFGGGKASTLKRILDRGELIVGLEAEFRPFEYVDESGEIVGFDVDLVKLMAEELGVKLRIVNLTWTALPTELRTGKIDLIASGMTATLERAKKISFTDPYYETGLCLLLHKGTADDVKSVHDLNDPRYRVVVKTGTTGDKAAEKFLKKAKILKLSKEGLCALEVAQGKVDAFVYDRHSVIKNQRRHSKTTRAITEPFTYEPYAMGIRKGDLDWWMWINQFLRQIKEDGRFDEIRRKYLGEDLGD